MHYEIIKSGMCKLIYYNLLEFCKLITVGTWGKTHSDAL